MIVRHALRMMVAAVSALIAQPAFAQAERETRIFFNAHVFTGEPDAPFANAVAVRDDKIVAVGDLAQVVAAAGPVNVRVDLHGKFLMPGMIDAHAHPIWGALATLVLANYSQNVVSVSALKHFVEATRDTGSSRFGDVVMIYNVDVVYWEHAKALNTAFSSGAFAKQPLVLVGRDGHSAWVNAAVRKRAGLTAAYVRTRPNVERGSYGVNSANQPNGLVFDLGKARVMQHLPSPSDATLLQAGRAAVKLMNGLGITAWLDPAVSNEASWFDPDAPIEPGYLTAYRDLVRRKELTAHVAAYPVVHPRAPGTTPSNDQQLAIVSSLRARFQMLPDLTVPGVKVFADGVPEFPSQTASLTKPYLNNGLQPPVKFGKAAFADLVTRADRVGLSVHVHAVGDLAVRAALDGFEAARATNGPSSVPHTITHLQFVHPDDIGRFAALNVLAAVQLYWATADPTTNEAVKSYIDADIYQSMYPARALLDAGTVLAGASDWPVTTANPFEAIYQAETRRGPQGVLLPEQRVPRISMLYAYTRNAAQVLGQLDRIGTIAPGKQADLVLLDRDLMTATPEETRDTKVVWTMFGGRLVAGTLQ